MKRRSWWLNLPSVAVSLMLLGRSVEAQQDTFNVTDYGGTLINYNTPIDALNFVNDWGDIFSYNNPLLTGNWPHGLLYDNWSDTLNFFNAGEMDCGTGFCFDTHSASGFRQAAGFYNYGVIACGTNQVGGNVGIYVNATNIVNSGTINIGLNGLARLSGSYLDFTAGTLAIQNNQINYNANVNATGATGTDTYQSPSRFLSEIPKELLNEWNLR